MAKSVARRNIMTTIIWIHGDCLSPHSPALRHYPNSPAIWVWDEALLNEWRISLKRITFIYECLLELPVVIRRGDVATEVARFAAEHQADTVATVLSPSPRFNQIGHEIRKAGLDLEVHVVEPFLDYEGHIDLKRFSRYWRVAQNYAFD